MNLKMSTLRQILPINSGRSFGGSYSLPKHLAHGVMRLGRINAALL